MKRHWLFLCGLFSISICLIVKAESNSAVSDDSLPPQPLYWEFFGGGGDFSTDSISQVGTINYPYLDGGDLDVDATGSGSSSGVWMVGVNMGYKWPEIFPKDAKWAFAPAAELEGYYLQGTQNGTLTNQISVTESDRRFVDNEYANQFSVSYPMHTGVFLLNAVLGAHQANSKFRPYVGGGIGAAIVSVQGASASQTDPALEEDINFYNSNTNATDWAFAAQFKAGVNYVIADNTSIFAEYRFLYLGSTAYNFGDTHYDDFPSTTEWDVNLGSMTFNMGTVGIRYDA